MNRTEKELIVTSLRERFREVKALIITDYRGLNVAEISSLRRDLRETGTAYCVVKNTIARRAIQGTPMVSLEAYFTGPNAIALNLDDPAAPAKVLSKYAKDNPKLEIKIGFLEGKVISPNEIQKLATISSRENLLASLLGTLQAPATGIVNVFGSILRKFLGTLEAIRIGKIQQ